MERSLPRTAVLARLAVAAVLVVTAPGAAAAQSPEPRIVGGDRIDVAQAPWQVALAVNPALDPRPASERQVCGGALLAPTLVVTAGHCVYDGDSGSFERAERFSVIAGRTALDSDDGREIAVLDYRVPTGADALPIYEETGGHARWDVAVLSLASEVPGVPIRIAGEDEAALWSRGQPVAASGWGATRDYGGVSPRGLKSTSLTIFSDATCSESYPAPDGFEPADMLCASAIGTDTCKGDSGGPLVATGRDGEARLVGLTSWGGDGLGPPCAWTAGVYARIASDPLRSQIRALAQELAGVDVVGSGAQPADPSPPLTLAEALQLTYNQTRDACPLRICWSLRAPSCSPSGGGFRCRAVVRLYRHKRVVTCAWRIGWTGSREGELAFATRQRCKRSRRS